VVTSTGAGPYRNAWVKNRRAAAVSRYSDIRTSMTWPYWSTHAGENHSKTAASAGRRLRSAWPRRPARRHAAGPGTQVLIVHSAEI
jgi:hypothetical protein